MILKRVLPVAMLLTLVAGYNYCNNKTHTCNLGGLKHFMCQLEKELPPFEGTKFDELVPDTKIFQSEVVGLLNNFRDMLASGEVMTESNQTFPSARRMRRLLWDKELAYLARTHASTVSFKHTECRSTLRFPIVGESMAIMPIREGEKLSVLNLLRNAFRPMWRRHVNVKDPEGLLQGFDPARDYSVGDFTLIISDRVSRVGCGVALGSNCPNRDTTGYCHFVTCFFDYNNVANVSVYKRGAPASGCDEWKTTGSNKWSHLCKNFGENFQNE